MTRNHTSEQRTEYASQLKEYYGYNDEQLAWALEQDDEIFNALYSVAIYEIEGVNFRQYWIDMLTAFGESVLPGLQFLSNTAKYFMTSKDFVQTTPNGEVHDNRFTLQEFDTLIRQQNHQQILESIRFNRDLLTTKGRGENHEQMTKIQVMNLVLTQGPDALNPQLNHNEPFASSEVFEGNIGPHNLIATIAGEDSNLHTGTNPHTGTEG